MAERRVLLAGPRSFCAGVERAIDVVERALSRYGAPVYVRRQIVHNTYVVRDLEAKGAVFVEELDEVPDGAVAVLAAHGVAPSVRDEAAGRRLFTIDATCPLVAKVHNEARRYAELGYSIVLVGHPDHEEIVGTRGGLPTSSTSWRTWSTCASCRCPRTPRSPSSPRRRSPPTRRRRWSTSSGRGSST
jgi:4-hydroxy-3-methylbut-2-enyl diphosphate reductase